MISAVDCIDAIIALLRGAKNHKDAKTALMQGDLSLIQLKERDEVFRKTIEGFRFTDLQAQAILDMRLSKLIGLEILSLQKSHRESLKNIKNYKELLGSKKVLYAHLEQELLQIQKDYGKERKTKICDAREAVYDDTAIEEMDLYYLQDRFGYVKCVDPGTFQRNKESIEADYAYVLPCKNTDRLLFFTDLGNMHQIKILDVPVTKFKDKGVPLDNLSKFSAEQERVVAVYIRKVLEEETLLFVTEQAQIKRVKGEEFATQNRLVQATKLGEEDRLLSVLPVEEEDIVLETEDSYFLRFSLSEVPLQKKTAKGVLAMSLRPKDYVKKVYSLAAEENVELESKTLNLQRLKQGKRGGKGVKHS